MDEQLSLNELTEAIIGAAIEVHRHLGPGLLESVYRKCLAYELRKRGYDVVEEYPVPVVYDGQTHECGFRADLIVNQRVVVELKAKTAIHPVDKAQNPNNSFPLVSASSEPPRLQNPHPYPRSKPFRSLLTLVATRFS